MALPFGLTPAAALSNIDTALDVFNIGTNIDIVGIYDAASFRQVFENARPLKARVRETSRVMDHPVETGVTLSDHHIILPVAIEFPLVIPNEFYSSTYQQIRTAFINATKFSVQTKTGVYSNMIIMELPHEEDADMYDAISMFLRFRQVQLVAPSSIAQPVSPANYSPVNPVNQNIVARGLQSQLIVTVPSAVLSYVNAFYAWGR